MVVYLIKKSTMGGSADFLEEAFVDSHTCVLRCKQMKEEWVSYEPIKADGEEISGNRIIVDGKVYKLNREDGKAALKKQALKKLNPDEREALGFPRK